MQFAPIWLVGKWSYKRHIFGTGFTFIEDNFRLVNIRTSRFRILV